ncbi:hypothetical protein [Vibrio rotiferianus]|uniref:hypothetical protein n=1 Tax=Vibrio rotiferianus TaxID=190895 RepID=UPI00148E1148|nr:hypothetical protein [Vibrio rotiferianus]NOH68763.1 hypothetical protein [Vibrio rotiferianus]
MSIKLAVVDKNDVIENFIIGNSKLIDEQKKFVSVDSMLRVGDTYTDKLALVENLHAEIEDEPIVPTKIRPTSVENAKQHNSTLTFITMYEDTDVLIKGLCDAPDKSITLTLQCTDETKKQVKFGADIVNREFAVVINIRDSGEYIFTDEQANIGLDKPMFAVDPIKIDVLRKTL